MKIAKAIMMSGLLLAATHAYGQSCGCGGGSAGYGGFTGGYAGGCGGFNDCNYAQSLWDGYCSEGPGCGCGRSRGLFSHCCGGYSGYGYGGGWYGFGMPGCGCGCGSSCGMGMGCGGMGSCGMSSCGTGSCGRRCGLFDRFRMRRAGSCWGDGYGLDCGDSCDAGCGYPGASLDMSSFGGQGCTGGPGGGHEQPMMMNGNMEPMPAADPANQTNTWQMPMNSVQGGQTFDAPMETTTSETQGPFYETPPSLFPQQQMNGQQLRPTPRSTETLPPQTQSGNELNDA